jgi:hypothetical protein
MEKLFEHAASIIKEAGKSALGFGSLMVLSVAVVGVLMFKDAKDEKIKLYAFFALLFAFMLFLFTLLRTTKKVAQKEERQLAAAPVPPPISFEVPGGGVAHYPPQAKRSTGLAGCVIGLVLFGVIGIISIIAIVGIMMMDLSLDQPLNSTSGGGLTTGGSAVTSGPISGYVSMDDGYRVIQGTGAVTISVHSVNPGVGYGQETFQPNEILGAQSTTDLNGNPMTMLTVDADLVKIRAMNE